MRRFVTHELRLGGQDWDVLAAPGREPELEGVADAERIPYWSVLWDSAPALAEWLADHPEALDGAVLELGCGSGLVGLVAAALGARVTQTDLFPEALNLAARNAAANYVPGIRRAAADWRAWPLRGSWPVILGADILYERASHAALLEVLAAALAPEGTTYLADPGRPMLPEFLARAGAAGWQVTTAELAPAGESRITLLKLRRGFP